MKQVRLIVSGLVQRVGYRAWLRREARKLNITGWVKNRDDDAVEAVLCGAKKDLDVLVKRCHHGPAAASVEHVLVSDETSEDYSDFIAY